MDCIFCKIILNEIPVYKVWEDNNTLVFLDINPINPGHILVVPKEHSDDLFELEESSYINLLKTAKMLAPKLKNIMNSKRVGMVVEGFGVAHTHIHLIPINRGNELNPERAKSETPEELKKIQILIRDGLIK